MRSTFVESLLEHPKGCNVDRDKEEDEEDLEMLGKQKRHCVENSLEYNAKEEGGRPVDLLFRIRILTLSIIILSHGMIHRIRFCR